jgi:hypothetical protein
MKKIILMVILLGVFSFSYGEDDYTADIGIVEKAMLNTGIKKDYSDSFEIDDVDVFTKKRNYRRVKSEIKNKSDETYEWVTFVLELEGTPVYGFTLFNVKPGKKYKFDSNVYVGSKSSKKMEISYIRGKAE